MFAIVGELKMKMPPPATLVGRISPAPPVSVNPSSSVDGVWPEGKTTTLHWVPVCLVQKSVSVQGCPAAFMVVTNAPNCEVTLTPGFMRIDSR